MAEARGITESIRSTLEIMIGKSNAELSVDEVLQEFLLKENVCHPKLLEILQLISKNQPKALEHLSDVSQLLEKNDPFDSLMQFLSKVSEGNLKPHQKKDVLTSTALIKKKSVDSVITNNFSAIKERFMQVVAQCDSPSTSNKASQQQAVLNKPRTDSFCDIHINEIFQLSKRNIEALPIAHQETLLLQDLIYCLTGMSGSYITMEEDGIAGFKFQLSEQINCSLRDMAQEILPVASYFKCMQNFIQNISFANCGQVLQALGGALKDLEQDYYLLLVQLEEQLNNSNLTLQKMMFYVRPTLSTFEILASAVTDIATNDLRGGQALTLLFSKINSLTGDEDSQKLIIQLTELAAVPYMEALQLWMQKGVIFDPQQEFLIKENEAIRSEGLPEHYPADYWGKCYSICSDRVPCFLESISDKILRSGKYLNVIRQCGKNVTPPQTMKLHFSPINGNHITFIQNAYKFASKNLLEVVLKENDLKGHLMSVKRYLLLQQGDFITQFMDACEDELTKNVNKVFPLTLENLLGLSIRFSAAKHDHYKNNVHCELTPYDLLTQIGRIMKEEEEPNNYLDLKGWDCFAFRYDVKSPISLVLNNYEIAKYQMLFRQFFHFMYVERQLCKIMKKDSLSKNSLLETELNRCAFALRHRMLIAVQNIEYYMMVEVIEPNWRILIQNINIAENMDEVLLFHSDFLDSCLKNCMLTFASHLNRSIFQLCKICLKFCEFMQAESSLATSDTFSERLKAFDLDFTGLLIGLLKQIREVTSDNPADRFINLVHRINFNLFYN